MATAPGRPTLVITNWRDLDHPQAGGAEVVCQELARRFVARGWHVILLAAHVQGRARLETRDGYWIRRAGGRFTVYAHTLAWLARHRGRVDAVIDSQNGIPFFTPLALRPTTPDLLLLHHVHQDQFAHYFPWPIAQFGKFLESTVSRAVYGQRGIVAVSPSTRSDARRRLGLRGEIWVAPPGWSVTVPTNLTRTLHPSIVCVGRLVPHKRTHLTVDAFSRVLQTHPDTRLTIIGRGPERQFLIDQARDAGITEAVQFRDDLDDDARDRALASAWFSVNPSQGEGWGLSVIEANALGVPVLAFRRPGLRDSIRDGYSGWLLEDTDDLASAMSDRITELRVSESAETYRTNARQWADQFTWEAMTDRVAAALASEQSRLEHGPDERRARSDAATVVAIPTGALPREWRGLLRDTDVWEVNQHDLLILCRGADTSSVRLLLDRLEVADNDGVRVRVAGTSDLLRVSTPTPAAHD